MSSRKWFDVICTLLSGTVFFAKNMAPDYVAYNTTKRKKNIDPDYFVYNTPKRVGLGIYMSIKQVSCMKIVILI
jgi:hypothetical protein